MIIPFHHLDRKVRVVKFADFMGKYGLKIYYVKTGSDKYDKKQKRINNRW